MNSVWLSEQLNCSLPISQEHILQLFIIGPTCLYQRKWPKNLGMNFSNTFVVSQVTTIKKSKMLWKRISSLVCQNKVHCLWKDNKDFKNLWQIIQIRLLLSSWKWVLYKIYSILSIMNQVREIPQMLALIYIPQTLLNTIFYIEDKELMSQATVY